MLICTHKPHMYISSILNGFVYQIVQSSKMVFLYVHFRVSIYTLKYNIWHNFVKSLVHVSLQCISFCTLSSILQNISPLPYPSFLPFLPLLPYLPLIPYSSFLSILTLPSSPFLILPSLSFLPPSLPFYPLFPYPSFLSFLTLPSSPSIPFFSLPSSP